MLDFPRYGQNYYIHYMYSGAFRRCIYNYLGGKAIPWYTVGHSLHIAHRGRLAKGRQMPPLPPLNEPLMYVHVYTFRGGEVPGSLPRAPMPIVETVFSLDNFPSRRQGPLHTTFQQRLNLLMVVVVVLVATVSAILVVVVVGGGRTIDVVTQRGGKANVVLVVAMWGRRG